MLQITISATVHSRSWIHFSKLGLGDAAGCVKKLGWVITDAEEAAEGSMYIAPQLANASRGLRIALYTDVGDY